MLRTMSKPQWKIAGAVAVVVLAVAGVTALLLRGDDRPGPDFVTRSGSQLMLAGKPFAAAGSNNYRPMFLDKELVDLIMQAAGTSQFQIMRVWGFNDIGLADGTGSLDFQNRTTYFHFWDGKAPAFNDGANGLEKLDYVVASAKKNNVRLVIPFVNNWGSFGGMDQYVSWANGQAHGEFYTSPTIRGWYKDWVRHLLERTNIYTKVKYKDEPTIAVWELANEARCKATHFPQGTCTTDTITAWAKEMAAHVKSIDRTHLLGFGDEGFMCETGASHWAYDCSQGVDARAIAAINDLDLVGLHLYPDHWGTDADWATDYLKRHLTLAGPRGKPVFLGEYGWRRTETRNVVFHQWISVFQQGGGDIALYWVMEPRVEGITPPDQDGFTAYCPSPVCTQVSYRSQAMLTGRTDFPPVPDEDFVLVPFGKTGTLDLLANDVSLYARIEPSTVDLDPAAAGAQASLTLPGGALAVAGGTLTYTPAAGYSGRVDFTYTVADDAGRVSEPANGTIRVASG